MLKVGLTGSIAVGKTYVIEIFRTLGVPVLDADLTAREVVAPDSDGWQLIVEHFGADILLPSRELNRAALGAIVFADAEKRQLLNSIVHPLVIENQDAWLRERERENADGMAIIDAALMIESGGWRRFDKIVVVWCDAVIQLQRLMQRNDLSETEALKRINAQMPQEEKKSFGDFLIETNGDFEQTRERTIEVFERLRIL